MLNSEDKYRLELAARLRDILKARGAKKAAADLCEVTPQAVNGWLTTGRIDKEHLALIARRFGHDLDELITGHKPYQRPDPHHADASFANVEPGPEMRGMVPIISEVQAGAWAEVIDNGHPFDLGEGGEGLIACPFSHGIRSYALRVTGDSMTSPSGRSYPHGCLIFVDPDQRGGVVSGDRVIAKVNGDNRATFKIYVEDGSRRFLRPLNPQYPIITDEFRILGKVLGGLID